MLPPTLTLCLSSSGQPGHSTAGFAVWVLPATPGQPERVESLPEKRRELGHLCPWTQGRKYAKLCTFLLQGTLHAPFWSCLGSYRAPVCCMAVRTPGRQAAYLTAPATCHPHIVICPWATAPHPTTLHAAPPGRLEVLPPFLCKLLFNPQRLTHRSLC